MVPNVIFTQVYFIYLQLCFGIAPSHPKNVCDLTDEYYVPATRRPHQPCRKTL